MKTDQCIEPQTKHVLVDRIFLGFIIDYFMNQVAEPCGGRADTQKRLMAEVETTGAPSAETIDEIIGYAAHNSKSGIARDLAKTFREGQLPRDAHIEMMQMHTMRMAADMRSPIENKIRRIKSGID